MAHNLLGSGASPATDDELFETYQPITRPYVNTRHRSSEEALRASIRSQAWYQPKSLPASAPAIGVAILIVIALILGLIAPDSINIGQRGSLASSETGPAVSARKDISD